MSSTRARGGFRRSWTAGAALTAIVPLVACSEPPPPKEILRPVRTRVVEVAGASRVRNFAGTAKAGEETVLSFRVSGRIESLPVRVGESVRRGQTIAQLEKEDFEISVEKARADLTEARATARNADADLERVRGLWENNNASQNDMDAALAQAESESARVESFRKALESAERLLGYTTLRVPVDGAIAEVPVTVNENVNAGLKIVMLTSGARSEVEIAMPEVLIAQIHEGDSVTVTFDALPEAAFDAVVTEVGVAAIDTAFPVTVRLTRASDEVRSGMAANVAFRFEVGHGEHIHLRPHAVGEDRDGRFVFILDRTEESGVGVVRRTPVEVGEFTREGLEIKSGVSEGQQVVTAGVRRLTDGQRVRLLDGPEESP